ncbi:hypothetical protein M109_1788 [Bacteroides fragilis str. 3397 N2]|nr:hypothetical protein M109_1788 [Bacteroides fragilis str. 3397 N2]
MIPADRDDIRKDYEVLLNELKTFNPEILAWNWGSVRSMSLSKGSGVVC